MRSFSKYYRCIEENIFPVDDKSIETVDKEEEEKLKNMLGLRLIEEGTEYFEAEKVKKLLDRGLLERFNNGKRMRLTKKGILLANDVFVEFI